MERAAMMRSLGFAAVLLIPSHAAAETIWVDGAASCPGEGSQAAPYCDPRDGLAQAQPGDMVWVRAFDEPYPALSWPADSVSGTPNAPIVLEPAPGESPVFTSPVAIDGRQHWVIRGLTVEGGPGPGIDIRSTTASSSNIEIVDNRVLGVGQRGIKVGFVDDLTTSDILVENNYVDQATSMGISLMSGDRIVVRNNVIERTACSSGEFIQQFGIEALNEVDDAVIAGNVVRGFPACDDPEVRVAAINVRTSSRGTIENNLVEVNVDADAAFKGGISVHIDSFDWTIVGNVVRGTSGCGLCDGADFGLATGSVWAHNTVLGVPIGFAANSSTGAVLEHNLIVASSSAVALTGGYGNFTARNNMFWTAGNPEEAFVVADASVDLEGFTAACACDQGSQFGEPALADDGLTPRAEPALDGAAASSWRPVYVGDAPDIGALEAPQMLDAAVAVGGDHIIASFEVVAAPLLPGGCEGIRVLRDAVPERIRTCVQTVEDTHANIDVELHEPLYAGDLAQLQVVHLVDSASVGGISGLVHPTTVDLSTDHLQDAPSGATSTGGPSAEPAVPPQNEACACRSTAGDSWAWVLFLLAARRRKRPPPKKRKSSPTKTARRLLDLRTATRAREIRSNDANVSKLCAAQRPRRRHRLLLRRLP